MEENNFNNDFDPEKDARLTRKIQLILLTITMILSAFITAWLFKG